MSVPFLTKLIVSIYHIVGPTQGTQKRINPLCFHDCVCANNSGWAWVCVGTIVPLFRFCGCDSMREHHGNQGKRGSWVDSSVGKPSCWCKSIQVFQIPWMKPPWMIDILITQVIPQLCSLNPSKGTTAP